MRFTIWIEDTPLAMHMGWLLTGSLSKFRFFAFDLLRVSRSWHIPTFCISPWKLVLTSELTA